MARHKGWLPREGFTLDTVQTIVEKTLLNPALTLPLYLLWRYYVGYEDQLASFGILSVVFPLLGAARWINTFLNDGLLNNWQSDIYDWSKELVLITGGSNGIGKALTKRFAENKITVIIVDNKPPGSLALNSHFYRVDLSSGGAITEVARTIQAQHGDPTVLINNAGTINKSPLLYTHDDRLVHLCATNILAYYRILREFAPPMVRADHGMIVTMASVAAYVTPAGMVDYSSSKAAAIALHEGISTELTTRYRAPKVRTVCVVPNFVRTKLAQGFVYNSPFVSPMLEPETVAEAVVAKVLSGRGGWVVLPKSAAWFGMMVRCWPWWMQRMLAGAIAHVAGSGDSGEAEKIDPLEGEERREKGRGNKGDKGDRGNRGDRKSVDVD